MSKEYDIGVAYAKRGCPDRMNAAEVQAAQSNPEEFWAGVDEVKSSPSDDGLSCLLC